MYAAANPLRLIDITGNQPDQPHQPDSQLEEVTGVYDYYEADNIVYVPTTGPQHPQLANVQPVRLSDLSPDELDSLTIDLSLHGSSDDFDKAIRKLVDPQREVRREDLGVIPTPGQKLLLALGNELGLIPSAEAMWFTPITLMFGKFVGEASGGGFEAEFHPSRARTTARARAATAEYAPTSPVARTASGIIEVPDIRILHGTSSNKASKIVQGGFKPGSDVYFAEDVSTAASFAYQKRSEPIAAGSHSVIEFRVPVPLAQKFGLLERLPIGQNEALRWVDVGSGYERILREHNIADFNSALTRKFIQQRRLKLNYFKPE